MADADETRASAPGVRPTETIGPYQLLQQIGEGGMGVVWLAEQSRPVRRKVALKIIKAGMDTAQVVARFEAERQALAMMDHPAIARVLEAGATLEGRPYFVTEDVAIGEALSGRYVREVYLCTSSPRVGRARAGQAGRQRGAAPNRSAL